MDGTRKQDTNLGQWSKVRLEWARGGVVYVKMKMSQCIISLCIVPLQRRSGRKCLIFTIYKTSGLNYLC
jgi:hypothetical protein